MKALKRVEDCEGVARWLGTYYISSSSLKEAVERFLKGQGHFQPSWRAVIFALLPEGVQLELSKSADITDTSLLLRFCTEIVNAIVVVHTCKHQVT